MTYTAWHLIGTILEWHISKCKGEDTLQSTCTCRNESALECSNLHASAISTTLGVPLLSLELIIASITATSRMASKTELRLSASSPDRPCI
jgi:hypothetical protein